MDTETTHSRTQRSNELPVLPEGKYTYHVYVSCPEDKCEYAENLVNNLRNEYGVVCYFPEKEILPGEFPPPIVSDKLEASMKVVLLMSTSYLENYKLNFEFHRAFTKAFMNESDANCLIPVLMEDLVLPPVFQGIQCIKAFDGEPVAKIIADTLAGLEFAGEAVPSCVARLRRRVKEVIQQISRQNCGIVIGTIAGWCVFGPCYCLIGTMAGYSISKYIDVEGILMKLEDLRKQLLKVPKRLVREASKKIELWIVKPMTQAVKSLGEDLWSMIKKWFI